MMDISLISNVFAKASLFLFSVLSLLFFQTTLPQSEAYAAKVKLIVTQSRNASPRKKAWKVSSKVRANIEEQHIDEGTRAGSTMQTWVQNYVGCPTNDDAGHYIGKQLGGTGTKYDNIFPENLNLNRGRQRVQEDKVKGYVIDDCDKVRATVSVKFKKNGRRKTRPISVSYQTKCVGNLNPGSKPTLPPKNWKNNKPGGCR